MLFLRVFLVCIFSVSIVWASPIVATTELGSVVVIEELLFDMNGAGKTTYDFKIYKDVFPMVQKIFPAPFFQLFQNEAESFVYTRLAAKEAEQLDVQADKNAEEQFIKDYKFGDNSKKNEAKNEAMKEEIRTLFQAAAITEIKQHQLDNRQALGAWLQVLKRKYSLVWKSNEFKNRIGFGL